MQRHSVRSDKLSAYTQFLVTASVAAAKTSAPSRTLGGRTAPNHYPYARTANPWWR